MNRITTTNPFIAKTLLHKKLAKKKLRHLMLNPPLTPTFSDTQQIMVDSGQKGPKLCSLNQFFITFLK